MSKATKNYLNKGGKLLQIVKDYLYICSRFRWKVIILKTDEKKLKNVWQIVVGLKKLLVHLQPLSKEGKITKKYLALKEIKVH